MPPYDSDSRGRRRPSPSYSSNGGTHKSRKRSRSRDHGRHSEHEHRLTRHSDRRDRSRDGVRPERYSRDRKSHKSRHDRNRSQSPYERSPRRRRSRSREHHRHGRDSNNPRRRPSPSRNVSPISRRSRNPLPSQKDAFTRTPQELSQAPAPVDKEKPNFAQTGRLAAETNAVTVGEKSIVLKYHEPPEARKPPAKDAWRLYVFKGDDLLETIELGGRSCWLVGRERMIADLPIDHPSCSKQHAAIQFRYIEKRNEYGDKDGRVRPYLIDLESANGSHLNGDTLPPGRYMELMDNDVLKFGLSTREYVLMLPPSD